MVTPKPLGTDLHAYYKNANLDICDILYTVRERTNIYVGQRTPCETQINLDSLTVLTGLPLS
jgi:hypothetical protein